MLYPAAASSLATTTCSHNICTTEEIIFFSNTISFGILWWSYVSIVFIYERHPTCPNSCPRLMSSSWMSPLQSADKTIMSLWCNGPCFWMPILQQLAWKGADDCAFMWRALPQVVMFLYFFLFLILLLSISSQSSFSCVLFLPFPLSRKKPKCHLRLIIFVSKSCLSLMMVVTTINCPYYAIKIERINC